MFLLGASLCQWTFPIIARIVLILELLWVEDVGLWCFPHSPFGMNRTECVTAAPNSHPRLQLSSFTAAVSRWSLLWRWEFVTLWPPWLRATLSLAILGEWGTLVAGTCWASTSPVGRIPLGLQPAGIPWSSPWPSWSDAGVGMEPVPGLMSCYWLLFGHRFPPPFPIPAGCSWGSGPMSGYSNKLFISGNEVLSRAENRMAGTRVQISKL